ncbi:MAG: hypothetical protein E6J13_12190 [Chloroflexi bacterium]|nr:MAG: hypothetical protein E6J13_12190 [Chloroflexota bacterium]
MRIYVSVGQQSRSAELVPSVLTRFQDAVGGLGYIRAPHLDERSATFSHQWRADSFAEAQAVIALLWSNLGPVKRGQATAAFQRFHSQSRNRPFRYRTPARPRGFPISAPGAAASTDEQSRAWAAGLFDGEGSTELHTRRTPGRTWFSLRSRVSQCDARGIPAVLQHFQAVTGFGRIDGPTSGEGYENAYKWDAGADDTLRVLPLIWPWLGTVKRVQAIDVIKSVDTLPVLRRHPWRDEAQRFAQQYSETSGISLNL